MVVVLVVVVLVVVIVVALVMVVVVAVVGGAANVILRAYNMEQVRIGFELEEGISTHSHVSTRSQS